MGSRRPSGSIRWFIAWRSELSLDDVPRDDGSCVRNASVYPVVGVLAPQLRLQPCSHGSPGTDAWRFAKRGKAPHDHQHCSEHRYAAELALGMAIGREHQIVKRWIRAIVNDSPAGLD